MRLPGKMPEVTSAHISCVLHIFIENVVAVEKAPYIHREPLMLSFLEGGSRGFGESKLKRNVFSDSEALAIVFPTAIVQIDYTNVHITLLTNVLVG